jgi:hypothetical protein
MGFVSTLVFLSRKTGTILFFSPQEMGLLALFSRPLLSLRGALRRSNLIEIATPLLEARDDKEEPGLGQSGTGAAPPILAAFSGEGDNSGHLIDNLNCGGAATTAEVGWE